MAVDRGAFNRIFVNPTVLAGEELKMSVAYQAAARCAPLAKAGVMAGLGKTVLVAGPAILVGAAVTYGLFKAFDVRWDEFSQCAADGESTMGSPS